jgi:hypothetical protein
MCPPNKNRALQASKTFSPLFAYESEELNQRHGQWAWHFPTTHLAIRAKLEKKR